MTTRLVSTVLLLALLLAHHPALGAARKTSNAALQPNPDKLNPPPGVVIPSEVKSELAAGVANLRKEIDSLQTALAPKPKLLELVPDVQVFCNAVQYALDDDIFYTTNQFKIARGLLRQGLERAQQLRQGQAPWNTATGLVVRGYVSRLDGSAQPYGLVVPATYSLGHKPMRLDFWLHGRGDNLSELAFIDGRQKSAGEFTPENAFVLHPYGRFMNAFKFAGEADVFEAFAHARRHYPIDENRVAMRGFSMGGAGTWHLGAHHAGEWAVVNPGAGFVDVKNYQNLGAKLSGIPWYEQKLWSLYDPLACPINFVNTSLIAYSGEIDDQKKAADLMEAALARDGIKMTHIIGPQTGHKYESEAKKEVIKLVDVAMSKGRDPVPRKVSLVTSSLKWNKMHWVEIEALEKHWEEARVTAELVIDGDASRVELKTRNVAAIALDITPASLVGKGARLVVDGQELGFRPTVFTLPPTPESPASWWKISATKSGGRWAIQDVMRPDQAGLVKRHNLQGPIDDAFMDAFLFVRPTARAMNEPLAKWTEAEMKEAIFQWRRQFRGQPRVKDDTNITDADIAANNLILWGDPKSNQVLGKIASKLPISWTAQGLKVGDQTHDARERALAMIYPNPLNPSRYIVINSGFTFARFGAASNSQQTPKLPDWAVLDISVPWAERVNGHGVADANFFGESWELKRAE